MNKTIFDYVTDNVESTLSGITVSNGYQNTLEVVRESKLGNSPGPSTPGNRYVVLVPRPVERRESSPIQKDDYHQRYWVECYAFEPDTSENTADVINNSIAADVIKAMLVDRRRGSHPANLNALAINTTVNVASPMDLQQAQYRGVVLDVDVWTRTAIGDPLNQ